MYDKITLSLFIQNVKQVKTMLHVIINELRFGLWQMIKIKKELCSFFLFMDRNIKWLSLVTDKKMWNKEGSMSSTMSCCIDHGNV